MLTREIPRNEWVTYFNNYSRNHHGWLITLEVIATDIGAQVQAEHLPLQGIAVDLKPNGKDKISIIVGDEPGSHVTHTITSPRHVRVELDNVETLQFESADEPIILLRFCSAVAGEC